MGKDRAVHTVKSGDIFTIPLGGGNVALGQIISSLYSSYYVIIFDFSVKEEEAKSRISLALQAEPFLSGLTFDALIQHGHWQVLENRPVDSGKLLPAYKTGTSDLGNCMIEDFEGKVWRPATASEEEQVPFRKTVAPIRFEKAMKAHMGFEPWIESYDYLRAGEVITSASLFPNSDESAGI